MNFYYPIIGIQLLEHCMAIYEHLGGTFYASRQEVIEYLSKFGYSYLEALPEELKPFENKRDCAIIMPNDYKLQGNNVFHTYHGLSEKHFYLMGGPIGSDFG